MPWIFFKVCSFECEDAVPAGARHSVGYGRLCLSAFTNEDIDHVRGIPGAESIHTHTLIQCILQFPLQENWRIFFAENFHQMFEHCNFCQSRILYNEDASLFMIWRSLSLSSLAFMHPAKKRTRGSSNNAGHTSKFII